MKTGPPAPPRVTAVVVSYNVQELLRRSLTSLADHGGPGLETVVVDNASGDGSAAMVAAAFPDVTLVAWDTNAGYARAANEGARRGRGEYIFFLNPDAFIHPGTVPVLAAFLDAHPRAGVVGPRLEDAAGRLESSRRDEPTAARLVAEHLPIIKNRAARFGRHDRPRRAAWLVGAALMVRRDAFDAASGFDEAFFLYYEDADLCLRLGDAGWEVWLEPAARVTHVGAASADAAFGGRAEVLLRYVAARNRLVRKRRGPAGFLAYRVAQSALFAGRRLGALLRGDRAAAAFAARAYAATWEKEKAPR